MIYISTLIVIFICAYAFDFGHVNNPRLKSVCYTLLLIWLIALSGFSYNVGSDIPGYMEEYATIAHHKFNIWKDLSYFENRQPGWILLNIICSRIYSKYVLFQIVMATFCNYVIFWFINKHTKYIFTAVFLYCVCSYLNFNFNNLRQTFAIVFFLIGYDYLVEKKWLKYFLCVLGAFMFHSTGIICILFPLFYYVKVNIKTASILLLSILALIVLMLRFDGADLLSEFFLKNADFALYFTDRERIVDAYFGENANKYDGLNVFGIIQMVLFVSPIILTIIGGFKRIINLPQITLTLLLFYLILYLLDFVIPVVFMRLVMYIDIIYYCALSDYAIDYPKRKFSPRIVFTTVLLCIALYRPVHTLFAVNPASDIEFYKQFYPYYSVFNPQIDPVRATYFGSYREY